MGRDGRLAYLIYRSESGGGHSTHGLKRQEGRQDRKTDFKQCNRRKGIKREKIGVGGGGVYGGVMV